MAVAVEEEQHTIYLALALSLSFTHSAWSGLHNLLQGDEEQAEQPPRGAAAAAAAIRAAAFHTVAMATPGRRRRGTPAK